MLHKIQWYKKGKTVKVNDKMQKIEYTLTEDYGKNFHPEFKPELSPQQMLSTGVFEGKYLNDCYNEFPKEWYETGKFSQEADPSINLFGIKSRLSLSEWKKRGWIPIVKGDVDVRGWFQWFCRYWIGRRCDEIDIIQIKRWKAFIRHKGQIIKSLSKPDAPKTKKQVFKHRPRQRQALLQWAYNPFIY